MTTKDEQPVEQLDAEIRAIEAADPTETSGAALLRGAKEEIERLQAEIDEARLLTGAAGTQIKLMTKALAEARAREERAYRILTLPSECTAGTFPPIVPSPEHISKALEYAMAQIKEAAEVLAAPAPEECPHGCRGTGWIGAGNSWGDTAALPCPLHEPIPKSEAERRVVEWPEIGSIWDHPNGHSYVVERIINQKPGKEDKFPVTVVYYNIGGSQHYGRRLTDWPGRLVDRAAQQEPTPDEESGDG